MAVDLEDRGMGAGMLTHLSLFSGIGGLDLAAEWAGFTTVGQCEFADYPTRVLEKHWPDVPRWRDIRTLNWESFHERTGLPTVDVISGGFPCQPFSVAGKQKGKGDDRYLWPEMLRVIRELAPRWVIGENVPGILRIAAADVVQNLEREGYNVTVFDFEAAAVGAPHRRERVFFVGSLENTGNSRQWEPRVLQEQQRGTKFIGTGKGFPDGATADSDRRQAVAHSLRNGCGNRTDEIIPAEAGVDAQCDVGGCGTAVADTKHLRCERLRSSGEQVCGGQEGQLPAGGCVVSYTGPAGLQGWATTRNTESHREETEQQPAGYGDVTVRDSDSINASKEQEICEVGEPESCGGGEGRGRSAEPGLGGMADGLPRWLDEPDGVPRVITGMKDRANRLKCLGNAVVPQQAYPIFRAIAMEEAKP